MGFFVSLRAVFAGGVFLCAAMVLGGLYLVVVPSHAQRAEWYLEVSAQRPEALRNALQLDPYRGDMWVAELRALQAQGADAALMQPAFQVVRQLYGMDDATYARFRHAIMEGSAFDGP